MQLFTYLNSGNTSELNLPTKQMLRPRNILTAIPRQASEIKMLGLTISQMFTY
jgi:hypothetical protein